MQLSGTQEYQFQYSPLLNDTSTRLLTLLPGPFEAPLRCLITEIPKGLHQRYEALSYAWGDPIFSRRVLVRDMVTKQERPFPITENLYEALLRLRDETASRVLWIDALCINQDDLKEKGHQVAQMGRLYREATRVVVWLGVGHMYPRNKLRLLGLKIHDARFYTTYEEVEEMKRIPWFFRVWTVQEYLLARDVCFQLGSLTISSSSFEKYIHDLWIQNWLHFRDVQLGKLPPDNFDILRRLLAQRTHLKSSKDQQPGQVRSTANLLTLTSQRECKDGRDRVYGLLGIISNIEMAPDYTLSPRSIFSEFVLKTLMSGDFSVLHACCIGTANDALPTYVPALSTSRTSHIPIAAAYFNHNGRAPFKAGLQYKPHILPAANARISIHGVPIDTVVGKLDFTESPTPTGPWRHKSGSIPLDHRLSFQYSTALRHILPAFSTRLHWQSDLLLRKLSLSSPSFRSKPYPYTTLFTLLAHTMTVVAPASHVSKEFNELDESDFTHHDYKQWTNTKQRGNLLNQSPLRDDCNISLLQRSLFWTKRGFIGIGTRHLQPGDQAVVFDGDCVAFLLRRTTNAPSSGETQDVFSVVGDCYVYGWMGEEESSAVPLYAGPASKGTGSGSGSGIAGAACASDGDAAEARVCPVSGGEVVPRMFVLQ